MLHLTAESLTAHGQVLFTGLDLKVEAGERVVVLGASGAGKTTLLNALYRHAGKNAALIPQPHGLVGPLSAAHNVALGRIDQVSLLRNLRSLLWMPQAERSAIQDQLLAVDLPSHFDQPVETLSGGEQSRTAIARALYRGSPLLIADEPCAALDPERARSVLAVLRARFDTIVCSMHDVRAGLALATRIIGVADRKMVFDQSVGDVTEAQLDALYNNGDKSQSSAEQSETNPLDTMPRGCM